MVANKIASRIEAALSLPGTWPSIRRYFVNTMFDSTFVMLGIIIAGAFNEAPNLRVVIATILSSAVALGISTGVSVFEAENLEQGRRIDEIEKAMLRSMEETHIGRSSRSSIYLIALVNFMAPIVTGTVILAPFLLFSAVDIRTAAWTAVGLAITLLFLTGYIMGRAGKRSPWIQAMRMALVGIGAFIICFYIESVVA
ncbi:MAG: VIT1/CCC1 transporter family protein [Methanomassiliicoccales archaeon]|nr:VIT1/CCC1 transporter family protein [Methanomassiliicoccales archaeon]